MQAEKHLKGLLLYPALFINSAYFQKGKKYIPSSTASPGFSKYFFLIKVTLCVRAFMRACAVCVGVPKKPDQGIRSLGAGVTDSCELSEVGAEN